MIRFNNIPSSIENLFGENIELLPSVTELFEFELAYLEYSVLPEKIFLERTAYTKSVNGNFSKHFLRYSDLSDALSENYSATTKAYFKNGQFSTGYATHSLFPYRGKFHPQLIKGLLNIIGIKKGETVLDPMAGSGTTNIEAALMGINSIAVDISPFCQLMIKTKYDSLKINLNLLKEINLNSSELFKFFNKKNVINKISKVKEEKRKIYNLALLSYLDALGYSKRVKTSNHEQLFEKVLKRYIDTIKNILSNQYFNKSELGELTILKNSDALNIELENNSVDAVITSPPYSFAIDYVENDRDQLQYLGYDINGLKSKMIGLKGKTKDEKLTNYFNDMDQFNSEVSRVLKKGKYYIMIIGSNTNQTGGIRLEETIIKSSKKYNLELVKSILKPIKGMRNTMKEEYVLIFEKK